MESLDFGSNEVLPYFGCACLETKLYASLYEVENVGDAGFFFELPLGRMHEMAVLGLHFARDGLPDTAPIVGAL